MTVPNVGFILDKSTESWTLEEANSIKKLFHEQRRERSVMPDILARALWDYWSHRSPDQPLFEDIEDNVALLLYARAYGERVPEPGDNNFFGAFLEKHKELFAPLVPPRLTWGPRAILAGQTLAGLDSPVMHAWVFTDGATLQQILIVGEGLPEIRQQVFSAAFMTSLQVEGGADDIMNIGVLRVELPGRPIRPLPIPFSLVGDRQTALAPEAVQTAQGALQKLQSDLQKLERDTGLVQVHEVNVAAQNALSTTLRGYAREVSDNPGRAILWKSNGGEATPDLVTVIPYLQIGEDTSVLSLALSADLLRTDAYKRLETAYTYATIERSLMDAGMRRDYYEREANRLEAEKSRYDLATPEERLAIWGPTVMLTESFDSKWGVTIKLAQPLEQPTDSFFQVNVPQLIEEHRKWQASMQRIISNVLKSCQRPDAPLHRFAVSRFFDAAIRGRSPDESHTAIAAFESWCKLVQPLLCFEWRCLLRHKGINPDHIFTPHTFFHTGLTSTENEDIDQVEMLAHTLLDQKRSVALFDHDHRVIVVRDATDRTEKLSTTLDRPGTADDKLWQNLILLAEQRPDDEERFTDALRQTLQQAPLGMMERILEALLTSRQAEQTNSPADQTGVRALEDNLNKARQETEIWRRINLALAANSVMAYQTARESLKALKGNSDYAFRIHLLRAIVECEAKELPFERVLPDIFYGHYTTAPESIQIHLERARDANVTEVSIWIRRLLRWGRDKAIRQLLRGLPQARERCSRPQQAALLARSAVESVRLARELEQAEATLAEEREAVAMAFVKVGWELEKILLAEFTGGYQDDLINLIAVLIGRESPKYPRMEGPIS